MASFHSGKLSEKYQRHCILFVNVKWFNTLLSNFDHKIHHQNLMISSLMNMHHHVFIPSTPHGQMATVTAFLVGLHYAIFILIFCKRGSHQRKNLSQILKEPKCVLWLWGMLNINEHAQFNTTHISMICTRRPATPLIWSSLYYSHLFLSPQNAETIPFLIKIIILLPVKTTKLFPPSLALLMAFHCTWWHNGKLFIS